MARGLIDRVEFQFTLPCRERQFCDLTPEQCYGFNSRSRVGSDAQDVAEKAAAQVSIHAPV